MPQTPLASQQAPMVPHTGWGVGHWLFLAASVLFAALSLGLLYLLVYIYRRQEKVQRNVSAIQGNVTAILNAFRGLVSGLAAAYWQVWPFIQIYSWRFLFLARQLILPVLQLVLFVIAGTATVVELWPQIRDELVHRGANPFALTICALLAALSIAGVCMRSLKTIGTLPPSLRVLALVACFVAAFEIVREVFGTTAAHQAVEHLVKNPYALFILFVLECLILWHDFSEFNERGRQRIEFSILRKLFDDLAHPNGRLQNLSDPAQRGPFEQKFRTLCATTLIQILRNRGARSVDLTIMQFKQPTNSLEIVFISGDEANKDRFDLTFAPQPGVSAAGAAYHNKTLVYLPNIALRHGIEVEEPPPLQDYRNINVLDSVYVSLSREPYRSLLCTPINGSGPTGFRGVLNLSSPRRRAFSKSEFLLAQVTASILAIMA